MSSKGHFLPLVFWETTTACNLECVHCRRLEVGKELSKNDLSLQDVYRLIEGLAYDFDPSPVLVLSGGEPLVRPDIFDIVDFAAQKEVPVALSTNGTLIDRKIAEKIAGSGIRRVSISLDGASSDTHDRFRQMPGAFDSAVQGISHLRSFGIPFQINTTITKHNVHELDEIYRLSLSLEADSLHPFLLVPVGCGLEIKEDLQLSPEEYEETLLKIYQLSERGEIHIRPICAPLYFRILVQKKASSLKRKNTSGMTQVTKGCLAGSAICFVSHKGDVFPCGYLPITCGNIRNQSLKDIWQHSDVFRSICEPDLLEGKCGLCRYKKICSGCRARAFEEFDNYLAEEPTCIYQPEPLQTMKD